MYDLHIHSESSEIFVSDFGQMCYNNVEEAKIAYECSNGNKNIATKPFSNNRFLNFEDQCEWEIKNECNR